MFIKCSYNPLHSDAQLSSCQPPIVLAFYKDTLVLLFISIIHHMLQRILSSAHFFEKLLACQFWQCKLAMKRHQAADKTQGLQSSDALQPVVLGVKLDPINVTLTPRANAPL